MAEGEGAAHRRMSPLKGLAVLGAVVVFVLAYFIGGGMLGIKPLFAGFLFLLYFGTIEQGNPRRMPAAIAGCLTGVANAWAFHHVPVMFGGAGMAFMLILCLVTIYCVIMGWLPFIMNLGFLLLLTVGTIPVIMAEDDFLGMVASIALAAAMAAVVGALAGLAARRSSPA